MKIIQEKQNLLGKEQHLYIPIYVRSHFNKYYILKGEEESGLIIKLNWGIGMCVQINARKIYSHSIFIYGKSLNESCMSFKYIQF